MTWRYETWDEYEKRIKKWHKHFCFLPVFYEGRCYWLTTIEKRCKHFIISPYSGVHFYWEYRK